MARNFFVVAFIFALGAGCTTGVASVNPNTTEPTPTATPQATPTPTPEPSFRPAGTWAVDLISGQLFTSSAFPPEPATVETRARVVVDDAGTLTSVEVCDLDLSPLGAINVTWPDSAIVATTVPVMAAVLDATQVGAAFQVDYTQLHGWSIDTDIDEAMPTAGNDARVADDDADNELGVTLLVDGNITGEVYTVNRTGIALDGTVIDDDTVEGTGTLLLEINILDSNPGALTVDIQAAQDATAGPTTFAMRRLSAEATCAEVMAEFP